MYGHYTSECEVKANRDSSTEDLMMEIPFLLVQKNLIYWQSLARAGQRSKARGFKVRSIIIDPQRVNVAISI
jgi:hypothetical protein